MPTLLAIAGLPGSGKTRYINSLRSSIRGHIADDYMGGAVGFTESRHIVDLARALNAGQDSLVCDILFCLPARRAEFEALIRRLVPAATIEWRFFENDPDRCLENVRRRVRIRVTREEELIRELSPQYQIPDGATILHVWRPG